MQVSDVELLKEIIEKFEGQDFEGAWSLLRQWESNLDVNLQQVNTFLTNVEPFCRELSIGQGELLNVLAMVIDNEKTASRLGALVNEYVNYIKKLDA